MLTHILKGNSWNLVKKEDGYTMHTVKTELFPGNRLLNAGML